MERGRARTGKNISGYHYFLAEAHRDKQTIHGMVAYWPLNRLINHRVYDLSGNNITGITDSFGTQYEPVWKPSFKTRFGMAPYFDGQGHFIAFDSDLRLRMNGNYFLEMWVQWDDLPYGTNKYIYGAHDFINVTATGWGSILFHGITGVDFGGGDSVRCNTVGALLPNVPYCVQVQHEPPNVKIWINNILRADKDYTGTANNVYALYTIGSSGATSMQPCRIDEVCVYNRLLTEEERLKRYQIAQTDV